MSAVVRTLHAAAPGFAAELAALRARASEPDPAVETTVREIIATVRRDGDAALVDYTRRFDRHDVASAGELELPAACLAGALRELDPVIRAALEHAADRVRAFHGHQRETSWQFEEADGTRLGQRITPLDRVGIYVPGGRAAYPSSVLMNAIPARVAGVGEVVMVTPAPGGVVNPAVLAAAELAGVDRVFTVGGAQAVAALAYGTPSLPRVDKIVGPGNIYVATAKRMVFGQVGIDMLAGPSEVVVICDATVDPEWVALDLLAQAEHDEQAQAIAISADSGVLAAVHAALARRLPAMPRRAVIARALRDHGMLIEARSLDDAIAIANAIAPEHLELMVADPAPLIERISHAGAIFVGRHSAEALGDYCAGPNHVLPTAGTARFSSPLGVYDFIKRSSVIQCSPAGAARLADTAAVLARSEGLAAHARAAEVRRATR